MILFLFFTISMKSMWCFSFVIFTSACSEDDSFPMGLSFFIGTWLLFRTSEFWTKNVPKGQKSINPKTFSVPRKFLKNSEFPCESQIAVRKVHYFKDASSML